MSTLTARRLVLPPAQVVELCRLVGVPCPPGFDIGVRDQAGPAVLSDDVLVDGRVHRSVAAGIVATCAPRVAVHIASTAGDVTAVFGVRDDLGGSLLRHGASQVEVSAWPAVRLGSELVRAVPVLGCGSREPLHLPLAALADDPGLRDLVVGTLRATVVAPPRVVGQVTWLATAEGWLSLEPAEVRDGARWAVVRPVAPVDLGAAVAPLVAAALS